MPNVTVSIAAIVLFSSVCVAAGCFQAGPLSCVAQCEKRRGALEQWVRGPDGEPVNPMTLCARPSVLDAMDACACKKAFAEEFIIADDELTCSCPEEEDTLYIYNDACHDEQVPVTAASCLAKQSPEYKDLAYECAHQGH